SVLSYPYCPPSSFFLVSRDDAARALHSFPTRRSSDLGAVGAARGGRGRAARLRVGKALLDLYQAGREGPPAAPGTAQGVRQRRGDRKSTRLNSSHVKSSYAVFCLKKKKKSGQPYQPIR